jgi:pimeloyl-ACP methyl ester carboxylesterase
MFTLSPHISLGGALRRTALVLFVPLVVTSAITACTAATSVGAATAPVRTLTFTYTSHDGESRLAYVVVPSWYGPENNPVIPVVISPHGRNANGLSNSKYFGNLPAVGKFAVISPDGMGRKDTYKSYGYQGQIDDLARMPELAEAAFSWLSLDHDRIYALGSSMGGQETALLVARHPELLAGAAAMDSVTDMSRRYNQLLTVPCDAKCLKKWGKPYGYILQAAMRREVGGVPAEKPRAYAARSPLSLARVIASSGVPLQIWWSTKDKVVVDQKHQSARLFKVLRTLNPCAPVSAYQGRWKHSSEMRATALLPIALAGFDLLPDGTKALPQSVRYTPALECEV